MRILIADDEPLVRLGIVSMIAEKYPGQHELIEACNGLELVRRAQKKPHLAFVDIRMPLMDGMEAIGIAREKSPDTQWMLLTGFSEFEYAQKAIRIGVSDYLLKPISPMQLAEAIDKAEARAREMRRTSNHAFESALRAYFYEMDLFDEPQAFLPAPMPGEAYSLFLLYPDCAKTIRRAERTRQASQAVQAALTPLDEVRFAVFALPTTELCAVTLGEAGTRGKVVEAMEAVSRMDAITVLATPVAEAGSLYAAYEHMNRIAEVRAVHGYGTFMSLSWLRSNPDLERMLALARRIDAIGLACTARDALALRQAVQALRGTQGHPYPRLPMENIRAYLENAVGLTVNAIDEEAWFRALMEYAQAMRRGATSTGSLIDQIKEYVSQHYMEDIGINTLADRMNITPNYLSRIFHQYADCRFVSYLSQVRVEAAKALLQRPGITVRAVAEAVGYQNARHFAKVFAKITGQTPSSYAGGETDDAPDPPPRHPSPC